MPQVAVIIPVFNRNELLLRAVTSVLNQTARDIECIIVDDGSTTPVMKIPGDTRCTILRLESHHGVSYARNRGAEATTAPLIAFLDSDDEWHPKKLEHQLYYFSEHPNCSILQSREIWIRRGVRVNPPRIHLKCAGDLFELSLQRCMITPSSVCLRRSLFEAFAGFNESLPACEDYDLWLRITTGHTVGLVDEYDLIRYGGHEDQLSATVPALDRFRVRSMLQLLQHATLSSHQYSLVQQQIRQKATILANGYKKRGNHEASTQYTTIATTFGA